MKYLFLSLVVVTVVLAEKVPNEGDYPIRYEVVNTSKVGSSMIGNFCTMSLRDRAEAGVAFIVQRRGYSACHVWDSGTIFHGRREKNEIRLLVQDDEGKLKVEHWPIAGTVAFNAAPPNPSPAVPGQPTSDSKAAEVSPAAAAAAAPVGRVLTRADVHTDSNPSGADIEVDGSFVGNTPSDIQITGGDHTVAVKKKGFKDWERKLKVSGGSSVHLNAELEKVTNQ